MSKEAMDAAAKLVQVGLLLGNYHLRINGILSGIAFDRQEDGERVKELMCSQVATALDAHTADLRAEVEALRARVAEHEDLVTVWGWMERNDGMIDIDTMGTTNYKFLMLKKGGAGKPLKIDDLHAAAEWVRSQSE